MLSFVMLSFVMLSLSIPGFDKVSKIGLSALQMTQRSDMPNNLGTSIKIQENLNNFSFNKDKRKILHFCE